MVKVYGASDDLCEIEGSEYKENEIGCYNSDVRIRFVDETVIRIGYPKEDSAIWWIEDAMPYSDIFEIDAEIKSHSVIKQKYPDRE